MRDYQVTVTTTVTRTYEVRTFSEESVRAIDWHTEEPLPGVEYGDCEIWEQYTWQDVREVEE